MINPSQQSSDTVIENLVAQQQFSPEEKQLIDLVINKDNQSVKQKNDFYQEKIADVVDKLAQNSPYPTAESQAKILTGVWIPIWTTIPFVDMIPGRIASQSYQIFRENYYANIARYLPIRRINFLKWLFSPAYDLMIVQKFYVENNQWLIENVAIKQGIKLANLFPLNAEKAQQWLAKTVREIKQKNEENNSSSPEVEANKFNKKWYKKLKTTAKAKPFFEHLYMSENLRVVRTYREANQRPSYTIAIRI